MIASLFLSILCISILSILVCYIISSYYLNTFKLYRDMYKIQYVGRVERSTPLTFNNYLQLVYKLWRDQ